MEDSKPHTPRRSTASAGRLSASSAHVIDLRQSQPGSPPAAAARPTAPKAQPRRRPKLPSRPVAAPAITPTVSSSPPSRQTIQPIAPAAAAPVAARLPVLSPRRFWPAFWRFLVLLVVLGFVVIGGVYLYVNYYRG